MALRIVADVLIGIGLIFALAGTKGIIKMPDAFCRMQASTCINTMGVIGVALGALVYVLFVQGALPAGFDRTGTAIKIAVIALLIITVNPIGSHAIAKGAYRAGIRPDKPMENDDLGRDLEDE